MAWWLPVLQAIGINAGKNVLTGKNPLDNALGAGIAGGVTGGLLDNTIPGAGVSSIVPGSIESELGMAGADGVFRNQDYFANVFGNPVYTGGEGLLTNVAGDVKSALGDITPQNLLGVASLLDQPDTSQYRQMAGTGGGVSRGSGQGLAVQMPQAKIFKRRKV